MQPNLGLDELFGAGESYVEFTPDLLEDLSLTVRGCRVNGRFFLQAYEPRGGQIAGWYDDGRVAAIEHQYGKGRTLLLGSSPGAGYARHPGGEARRFFQGLLEWAGVEQNVRTTAPLVHARLHVGQGGTYLWVVNPTREPRSSTLRLASCYPEFQAGMDVWQGQTVAISDREIAVVVEDRNAAVVSLQ